MVYDQNYHNCQLSNIEGATCPRTYMAGIYHNVYKTVCLSEDLLVYSYTACTIRAVWAVDGDRPYYLSKKIYKNSKK
jgi:hypothetical protein